MQKQKLNHNSCMRNLEKIPICVRIYFNDFQLFNTIIIESIAMPLTCNVNSIYYFRTFVGKSDSCRSFWYCPNQRLLMTSFFHQKRPSPKFQRYDIKYFHNFKLINCFKLLALVLFIGGIRHGCVAGWFRCIGCIYRFNIGGPSAESARERKSLYCGHLCCPTSSIGAQDLFRQIGHCIPMSERQIIRQLQIYGQ